MYAARVSSKQSLSISFSCLLFYKKLWIDLELLSKEVPYYADFCSAYVVRSTHLQSLGKV